MFKDLTEEQYEKIKPYCACETFEPYSNMIQQGEQKPYFYVLLQGEVELVRDKPMPYTLGRLGSGDFFGEMTCLAGGAVPFSVHALTRIEAWRISREGLLLLMDLNAEARKKIVDVMALRLKQSYHAMESAQLRSTVLSSELEQLDARIYGELQGESEAISKLRQDIKRAAAHLQPVCIVGETGTGKRHAAARIHYQSRLQNGPLLYVNGDGLALEDLRNHLLAAQNGTLVVYHGDQLKEPHLRMLQKEQGTRWMIAAEREIDMPETHKLYIPPLRERKIDIPILARFFLQRCGVTKPGDAISNEAMRLLMLYPYLEGNVEELYRMIQKAVIVAAGKRIMPDHITWGHRPYRRKGRLKVGLALGSGTVRGTAHLGVLKVLEDAGIPIDIVTGTSAGALVGALYASGMSVDEMRRKLPHLGWRHLARPVFSGRALFSNEPLGKWVNKQIGRKSIEDCRLPFAAVAADETTGEAVIFQSGPVDLAVQASTAIPGIMHPVCYQDRQLIDGAVVHRVPVALARSMGADIVIGVDVEVPVQAVRPPRFVWNTFLRTYFIMSERLAEEELQLADVVIKPQMSTNIYRFKYAPEFLSRGEAAARHALPAIRALLNEDRRDELS